MKFCYEAVPEKVLYIDLPDTDGLKLKTILRGDLDKPVVVMVHGLPGDGNELRQYLGARYLYEKGFTSLRLYLYDWEANTRNLVDCTVQTHADDFDAAVTYLRKQGAPKVFATGHSYGGLTVLKATAKLDGAVLWDPSHGLGFRDPEVMKFFEDSNILETGKLKLFLNGPGYIEPKAITEEQLAFGDNSDWAAHKSYPLKIISAGKGILANPGERYIAEADEPKAHSVIEGAGHLFEDSDEVMLDLFEQTADWFKGVLDA